jgi:hypothetical protein
MSFLPGTSALARGFVQAQAGVVVVVVVVQAQAQPTAAAERVVRALQAMRVLLSAFLYL